MVQGSGVAVDGVISYAGSANVSSNVSSDGVVRDVTPVASNLDWAVADFAIRSPLDGVAYHRHIGYWWVGGQVEPGIHYVAGDVQISASAVHLAGVTIVATGTVGISGSGLQLSPAAPELPTVLSGATGCYQTGINLSASSIEWSGVLAAPAGRVQVNGSNIVGGEILAGSIQMSGSNIELGRVVDDGGEIDSPGESGKDKADQYQAGTNKAGGYVEIIVESGDPVLCSEAVVAAARKAGKSVRESLG
jgi:hypothetical protein